MSRPRNRSNNLLPVNLYRKEDKRVGRVYYSFRNPLNGKFFGLGSDQETAINDAHALNSAIYASISTARLSSIIHQKQSSQLFGLVILKHMELCEERKLSPNTLRTKKTTSKAWERALGSDTPIQSITVRQLVEVLESYGDRPRMSQAMRSAAIDIWKDAMEQGWAEDNLASKTRAKTVEVQRSRLTLEDFIKIHTKALTLSDSWVARAMELALVTCQRREDISSMEFKYRQGAEAWIEEDALCVIQHKTKTKLRIPLDVGIFGMTVGGVIKSCRDNIVSKWLIHHQRPRTLSRPGDQVWIDTISKGFAKVRDLVGVTGSEGRTPPTFHEIRSLSIRLYKEAYGPEFAQAMAGHKDAATTSLYLDVRGSEWLQIRSGK